MSKDMRCDSCIYWSLMHEFRKPDGPRRDYEHPDDYKGKCHRFPPQLDTVYAGKREDEIGEGCESLTSAWYQPLTTGSDWCGEHKPHNAIY